MAQVNSEVSRIPVANLPVVTSNVQHAGSPANPVLATVSPAKSHAGVGIAYF